MKNSIAISILLSALLGTANAEPLDKFNQTLWRGADLSYVNELENCGAKYSDEHGKSDPYEILKMAGANVVRLRLWHDADWTKYSGLEDVKKSIKRAKALNMKVLLDYHYSDDWTHPGKQLVPKAWKDASSNKELANRLYAYTKSTLMELASENLLPEYVQIGNETNTEMLLAEEVEEDTPINWTRNIQFLNAGIKATREVSASLSTPIGIMLHVAQPENVEQWFDDAFESDVEDFDLIGISYYSKWSKTPFSELGSSIKKIATKFEKDVVIVETAYPWTNGSKDNANNLFGTDNLIAGFPATIEGQKDHLIKLMETVIENDGLGVVYWEPAWISSTCKTRWAQGSHWENVTLFDFDGKLTSGADFLGKSYAHPSK